MSNSNVVIRKTVTKDNKTKTVTVEKAENGYIITFDSEYKEGDEWKYDCKKYISKTNPLDDKEEKEEMITAKEFLSGL